MLILLLFLAFSIPNQKCGGRETSQKHRMFGVGRDLCGSPSPTPLPKQGHPEQAAQSDLSATGTDV